MVYSEKQGKLEVEYEEETETDFGGVNEIT